MGLLQSMFGGKANSLYKQGINKANKRDFLGAIESYTAILEMAKAPLDIKMMARLNRALAYSSTSEYEKAIQDLEEILADNHSASHVRTAAEEKLARYRKFSKKYQSPEND